MRRKIDWNALRHMDVRAMAQRLKNSFTEGWYLKGDESSQDRVKLVKYNYVANIIANLIGGSFYTGLLLLMHADDAFIGTMTMISTAANMLQLFAPLMWERFPRRRHILVRLNLTIQFLNIVFIGIIPLFPLESQAKLTLVAMTILALNVLNALMAPGLTTWHLQSLPQRVRPSYFSLITMTVGVIVAVVNLAASGLVDIFKANGMEYEGLLVLRGICFVLAIFDFRRLRTVREYPYESTGDKLSARELLLKPLHNKLYMRTVIVAFVWNFAANIPGQYYNAYLLQNVEVSYTYLMIINLVNVPIVMLLTPVWARFIARFQRFRVLSVAMGGYVIYYALLACVTRGTLAIYPCAQIFAFFMATGINLSFTAIPFVNLPQENQTAFIGFYTTMANLAAFLGVTLGKYFVLWTENVTISFLGITMINRQFLLLLTSIMMLGAAISVYLVKKSLPGDTDI